MKKIPKDKLVQGLKILYKLWNREYESEYPSKYDIEWGDGLMDKFYQKNQRNLGLGNNVDDYYYWMNALVENEDKLDDDTISTDNVIIPKWNTFDVETYEDRLENVTVTYEGQVEGYFNKEQLGYSFYELGRGESFDLYDFSEVDRDYGDIESGNGIELSTITLVSDVIPESNKNRKIVTEKKLDLFIDSLTESETKFLINKLQKKLL